MRSRSPQYPAGSSAQRRPLEARPAAKFILLNMARVALFCRLQPADLGRIGSVLRDAGLRFCLRVSQNRGGTGMFHAASLGLRCDAIDGKASGGKMRREWGSCHGGLAVASAGDRRGHRVTGVRAISKQRAAACDGPQHRPCGLETPRKTDAFHVIRPPLPASAIMLWRAPLPSGPAKFSSKSTGPGPSAASLPQLPFRPWLQAPSCHQTRAPRRSFWLPSRRTPGRLAKDGTAHDARMTPRAAQAARISRPARPLSRRWPDLLGISGPGCWFETRLVSSAAQCRPITARGAAAFCRACTSQE